MGMSSEEFKKLNRSFHLANGIRVLIRPIQPTDSEIEWSFVHNLSAESRYLRFMSVLPDLTPSMVKYFTDIDLDQHMALIATVTINGHETEVAVGRYFKLPGGKICEFALAVADDWQGKGIGHQIMQMLIANAKERGLETMEGDIFSFNQSMLSLVKSLGFSLSPDKADKKITKAILLLKDVSEI